MPNQEQLNNLENQLTILNRRLEKKTSFKYLFAFAVVQGIGYAVGATLIAGLVIAIMARLVVTLDYVPFLNQMVTSEQLRESFIDNSNPAK